MNATVHAKWTQPLFDRTIRFIEARTEADDNRAYDRHLRAGLADPSCTGQEGCNCFDCFTNLNEETTVNEHAQIHHTPSNGPCPNADDPCHFVACKICGYLNDEGEDNDLPEWDDLKEATSSR